MRSIRRETFLNWRGYVLGIVLVALGTWFKYLAQPYIIPADEPILYIAAIVPVAIFFGIGPALLVCILSVLAYDYFFIPPTHIIGPGDIQDAPVLGIFLLVGVALSILSSRLRHQVQEANTEIAARKKSETELAKYRDHLEDLVKIRTVELDKVNSSLKAEVSERKNAEEALKSYSSELEAFTYSVSHDLKAPLRTLDGFSEAVIDEYGNRLDEKGVEYLTRVRGASQHMSRLIDDMLKLSRISQAEMNLEKVDLSEIAQSIIDELKAGQPERQVEFIIPGHISVNGDKRLLKIAMRNLLENAWKFTSKCSLSRIEVGETRMSGTEVYFIRDNGVGFDMKYSDKLFQAFSRLHSSKEYNGTGIGLAIVQRVIHRHGGRIWADAEIARGATFFFTLD